MEIDYKTYPQFHGAVQVLASGRRLKPAPDVPEKLFQMVPKIEAMLMVLGEEGNEWLDGDENARTSIFMDLIEKSGFSLFAVSAANYTLEHIFDGEYTNYFYEED